jgi:O-antigen ligase
MMAEFVNSPLFGSGAGAAAQYQRSIEQPWAYELAYIAFLFQYGVVGFIIYAAGIILLTYHLTAQIKKNGRNSFEFFYLAGFISFMIANATNPYLAKFDYMWVLFIPVAIMNQSLLRKISKNPECSK